MNTSLLSDAFFNAHMSSVDLNNHNNEITIEISSDSKQILPNLFEKLTFPTCIYNTKIKQIPKIYILCS